MTRDEHLEWAKRRALLYLDVEGDVKNAVTSMLSDLSKHEELKGIGGVMAPFGLLLLVDQASVDDNQASVDDVRRFIEGFR